MKYSLVFLLSDKTIVPGPCVILFPLTRISHHFTSLSIVGGRR